MRNIYEKFNIGGNSPILRGKSHVATNTDSLAFIELGMFALRPMGTCTAVGMVDSHGSGDGGCPSGGVVGGGGNR